VYTFRTKFFLVIVQLLNVFYLDLHYPAIFLKPILCTLTHYFQVFDHSVCLCSFIIILIYDSKIPTAKSGQCKSAMKKKKKQNFL